MFRRLVHRCFDALDRTHSLVMLVRLWVLDWFAGLEPKTEADLRKAA
jgi:hypothetical protein